MNELKNVSLAILISVCLIRFAWSDQLSKNPDVQVAQGKEKSNQSKDISSSVLVPEMVFVQEGQYRTVADESKEIAPKDYKVEKFWIGKYEVTFEEYDQFCSETGYYLKRYHAEERPYDFAKWKSILGDLNNNPQDFKDDSIPRPKELNRYPVVNVCWLDAMAYCLWLSNKTGISFRLPTQTEWEYAYNGITAGTSLSLDDIAWYNDNMVQTNKGFPQMRQVGLKAANPRGCYDMLGNVWEWCLNGPDDMEYEKLLNEWDKKISKLPYSDMDAGSPYLNPISTIFQGTKALRGGAWEEPDYRVSAAFRMFYPLNYRAYRVGFRIATSEDPSGLFNDTNEYDENKASDTLNSQPKVVD